MRIVDVEAAVRGSVVANGHLVKVEEAATATRARSIQLAAETRHHVELIADARLGQGKSRKPVAVRRRNPAKIQL